MEASLYLLTVTHIQEELAGVKTITVSCSPQLAQAPLPGQFISLVFNSQGAEQRRSYSISHYNASSTSFSFTVKRVPNGSYSRYLTDQLRVGDTLYSSGVSGRFTLPENITTFSKYVFFAAGIGITPILPLIEQLMNNDTGDAVLIYSNRSQSDTVFYKRIQQLQSKYENRLSMVLLFSDSKWLDKARLNKENIPKLLNIEGITDYSQCIYYICGPSDYKRMVQYALAEHGVPSEQILKENFFDKERSFAAAPISDTTAHMVHISYGSNTYSIMCQYPQSILDAALAEKIQVPYSCKNGQCGSCIAQCTTGRVEMHYNEVLTDKEIANGHILLCTAHPVNGDVNVSI